METTPRDTAPRFDVKIQGFDLLKVLGDLLMQEEANLWVASGLFTTANSVLLVALFGTSVSALSLGVVGGFGLLLSFAWMVALGWVRFRMNRWTNRVKALQDRVGIPEEISPWGGKSPVRVSNWKMLYVVDLAFYLFWGLVLAAAGGQAGLWKFPY